MRGIVAPAIGTRQLNQWQMGTRWQRNAIGAEIAAAQAIRAYRGFHIALALIFRRNKAAFANHACVGFAIELQRSGA